MPPYDLAFKPAVGLYGQHDPSAALFDDGELVFAVEEERLTRQKHATNTFPERAIRACLDHRDLDLGDVDRVLLPYDPSLRRKILSHSFRRVLADPSFGRKLSRLQNQVVREAQAQLYPTRQIEHRLERLGDVPPIENLPHHACHAASAFHPSGFDEAVVLTVDAKGEYDSTVVWHGTPEGLERIRTYEDPNSLGMFFAAVTELAGGDAEQVTAATPALMLIQLLLLPLYLWLFMGQQIAEFIEAGPFIEAFVVIIALPLMFAWATEHWAERSSRGEQWQDTMGWLPVPMMGVTLFVVIASQLPRVQDSIGQIAAVVPVYVAFLVIMPLLGRLVAGFLGMDVGESRALVFTSVTRNSLVILPLALALPSGYELAPAVVVTQTLVELTGMVVLTRVVPAWLVPEAPDQLLDLDVGRSD
jgi:hypothetical protein